MWSFVHLFPSMHTQHENHGERLAYRIRLESHIPTNEWLYIYQYPLGWSGWVVLRVLSDFRHTCRKQKFRSYSCSYCSFAYQKIEKILNVSICHVVAEADRYVPGLATAKSRVLKLEELAKICSVQYWSLKNSVPILMPSSRGFDLRRTFSRERIRQFKNRRALRHKELNFLWRSPLRFLNWQIRSREKVLRRSCDFVRPKQAVY